MGLQTENRTFELVFEDSSVFCLTNTLRDFEYTYNLLSLLEQYGHGSTFDLDAFSRILNERQYYGLEFTNLRLREILVSHELVVSGISKSSPIQIELKGLVETVKALASIFDPIAWQDRWEDLKHKRKMNRLKEQKEEIVVIAEKIKQLQSLSGIEALFRNNANNCHESKELIDQVIHLVRQEVAWLVRKQEMQDNPIRLIEKGGKAQET